jgi:N6-L-threonylcarbamoyladenine synthase
VRGVGAYRRLGTTIDDAAGEAFDKTAKLLRLGIPGGPRVEALAREGDPKAVPLPRPLLGTAEPHFSFAGLKSAVMRAVESGQWRPADIAASFQQAVVDCLVDRTRIALERFGMPSPFGSSEVENRKGGASRVSTSNESRASFEPDTNGDGVGPTALVVAGGVAANGAVRAALQKLAADNGLPFVAPPLWLCTDNAAMIGWAGAERFAAGLTDDLDFPARPRWPLDPEAETVRGAGVKA